MSKLKHHKGLAVAHLNVRSLWKKLDSIRINLHEDFDIDILGISESWLSSGIEDNLVNISNYSLIRNDRAWSENDSIIEGNIKRGGGVCMYIKKSINYITLSLGTLDISCKNVECHWVKVMLEKQRNIIICNVYRPPQGNMKCFVEYMENVLENIDSEREDIIIMGDMNVDFLEKTGNDYKIINSFITQFGLDTCIKEPTHFSTNRNTCIDQFLTNSNYIDCCGVENLNISDHQLIFLIRKKTKKAKNKTSFWGISYRNYDQVLFQTQIAQHDWTNYLIEICPNKLWSYLIEKIEFYIDLQCPLKKFKISQTKEPWVTPELLEFVKDKDRALRKAKRSKSNEDWEIAKRLRNECLTRVRNCKSNFIQNELNVNRDDGKQFWNTVKQVIPDSKSKNNKMFLIDEVTNNNVEPQELPDFVNNFFADIGQNLANQLKGNWSYSGITSDVILRNVIVNEIEINKACHEINVNKSSSIKNVSSRIIKDAFLGIPHILQYLIQQIFDTGIFPDCWKVANITPPSKRR